MRIYPRRILYAVGQRFSNFIIEAPAPTKQTECGRTYTQWVCHCDCGKRFITTTKQIRKGVQKSCGCTSISHRFKVVTSVDVITTAKINHYKSAASRRGLSWLLTYEQFKSLIFKNCVYCGATPYTNTRTKNHAVLTNGVDRVMNEFGYDYCNSVTCCEICNRAKAALSLVEFKRWIERLRCHG
jgi:hypothetical protein